VIFKNHSFRTHHTNWESLLSQTLASVDKDEFRAASAGSPNGTCRQSSVYGRGNVGSEAIWQYAFIAEFWGYMS
jgi:hypothetical protein